MAAGIGTRGLFPYQFDKTVDESFNDGLFGVPDEASAFFSDEAPKGGTYNSYSEFSGLETLRQLGEGESPDFVVPAEGNVVKRYFTKYGLAYQATLEAIQDELFDNIKNAANSLGKSAAYQQQYSQFALIYGGFATYKTADGQYLFSSGHTLLNSSSTISNVGAVDLSETGMQTMFEYFDNMKTNAGYPDPQVFKSLMVSPSDRWMAQKLMKTNSVLGSANNDILTTNPDNGIMDWTYKVCHYSMDSDAWFGFAQDPGLRISWKMAPEKTEKGDWSTEGKMYKVLMRFSVYANRYQGMYGSTGA